MRKSIIENDFRKKMQSNVININPELEKNRKSNDLFIKTNTKTPFHSTLLRVSC